MSKIKQTGEARQDCVDGYRIRTVLPIRIRRLGGRKHVIPATHSPGEAQHMGHRCGRRLRRGGTSGDRSSVEFVSPARTGGRVRSAHRLLDEIKTSHHSMEKREDFQCPRPKNDEEINRQRHCKPSKTSQTLGIAAEMTEASAKAGLKYWWTE